jgi:hypothetical protein
MMLISSASFARNKSKSDKKNGKVNEITSSDPTSRPEGIKDAKVIFKDDLPSGGYCYAYGGKTNYKVQSEKSSDNKGILVCNLDNSDYCGVTLALGSANSIDLSKLRNERKAAALAFWAKGAPGVKQIYVGMIDDNPKVQTRTILGDWGEIDTTWKYYMIPLRKFGDAGKYWDDSKKTEVDGNVNWKKINEIRFSNGKNENKVAPGEMVTLYVDQVTIIDSMITGNNTKDGKNTKDTKDYWSSFNSDKPDVMLHDLESPIDQKWSGNPGPKSEVKYEIVKSDAPNGGKSALKVTFKMNDWCDMNYRYQDNNSSPELRDWSNHWGIKFDMYSPKGFMPLNLQVNDSGDELFVANTGGQSGWTEVLVPFKSFIKFPYYQPPQAIQNGTFDLKNVIAIDFKPAGEGTSGWFIIDNVRLTNEREAKVAPVLENADLTLRGDFAKVITQSINPGIFGINVALWDADLLEPETFNRVKDVKHSILRYPGGLRADDDHWKEVLDKKDGLVDADEVMNFAEKTSNSLMVTVNFGSGTPEEAAAWVKHYNIDQKKNVKYWEIGNELYGDWHNFHCSAEDYGKRSVEFIKAMKAVDPKIKCAVVWVLDGEWNKKVFEYVKNYADGVIIHHYPQHTGEENDAGLLSAPQSLNDIIPGIRKQIKEHGVSGKHYQIWLTEWNSVDFKPGPQTLGLVNGLFVADYLGMLAVHNIEHADYWDVHNELTMQGGDYGYLSRTGAPDGDNVPRASYWAFRMASESLRGKLVESKSANEFVTTYLTNNNGRKSLLIVNKYPKTKANITFSIPGFKGAAVLSQLVESNKATGPSVEQIDVKDGMKLTLPAYSITTILLK